MTHGDLLTLISSQLAANERQPGEYTTADIAERLGVSQEHARDIAERLVNSGKASRRKAARYIFYRLA